MSAMEPSSLVQRSASPLIATGLRAALCTPVKVHSRSWAFSVSSTRLVAKRRSSMTPRSASSASMTFSRPRTSVDPANLKCASSASAGPSCAKPGEASAFMKAFPTMRSLSIAAGPASAGAGGRSSDCQSTGGGGGLAMTSGEQAARTTDASAALVRWFRMLEGHSQRDEQARQDAGAGEDLRRELLRRYRLVRLHYLKSGAEAERNAVHDEHLVADVGREAVVEVLRLAAVLCGGGEPPQDDRWADEEPAGSAPAGVVAVAKLATEALEILLGKARRLTRVVENEDRLRGGRGVEGAENQAVVFDRHDDDLEAQLPQNERQRTERHGDDAARWRCFADGDVDRRLGLCHRHPRGGHRGGEDRARQPA